MVNLGQFYGSMTFYVTLTVSLIGIGFIIRTIYLSRQHSAMRIVTNTTLQINLAMYSITALVALSYSRYVSDTFAYLDEQTIFAITYMVYFGLWILANSYFLNKIARIPPDRLTQFRAFKWVLNIEILLLGLLGLATSNVIPIFQYHIFGLQRADLVELVFVVLSQIGLITFISFYRALGREKDNNASKLIKARIQLMQYAIFAQIVISLTVGVAAGLLAGNVLPVDQMVEFSLFTIVSLISLATNFIMLSSINIPQRIRVRFNIAPKRFKFVMANNN